MIRTEKQTINGRLYVYTYSDIGVMIERNGVLYNSALDPEEKNRTYTETNLPIEVEDISDSEALAIITGGAV